MSGNVRARRPASPPPGYPYSQQRFPHPREEHLDADERRAAASKGLAPHYRKMYPLGGLDITSGEWKLLGLVTLLACFVRLYKISTPDSIVFDEVHFGKFASRYIKTRYFVDVHPPLAKLLITFAGFLFGYDGDFEFKEIGKVYENVPYVAMRMLPGLLGIAAVPLSYLTLRGLDCRVTTALLASIFVTFENALVTQSRHILLDSPLIFFTALTVFFWVGFSNEDKHEPFTESWWLWLTLSGLSLGAVLSCKWVGLFTVATIGFSTILQLWNILGDVRQPPRVFVKHFMARALCLIVIPLTFYMMMFAIHFALLGSSGEGDGFMSSEFQHTLGGRHMADTYADVAIGSKVTIRHVNTQGGYLHSHLHNYPTGSKQQQITLYPHRDTNNDWQLFNASMDGGITNYDYENEPLVFLRGGDRIKLRHTVTEKHLHSHDHRPPVSDVDFQNEVSAYGMSGFVGDANDDWRIVIHTGDKRDPESYQRLRTLRTKFRLQHILTGCFLFSHKVKLPEWGFEQQEVTCNKNAILENSLWYIETNTHPALEADAETVNYKLPGFFSKFWELQQVMWITNAGLTERHTYDSRPESWPYLRRGINFWVKDHRHIYLIGNPMVWWISTAAVVSYLLVRVFLILRAKRGYKDFNNTKVVKYDSICGFLFAGWFLHYFPFFLMGRQLFLHHYLPALYFSILLCATVFDLVTSTLRPKIRLQIAAVLSIIVIWNYVHFSPLVYGTPWTKAKCHNSKWLKTWDFSCNEYLDSYSAYHTIEKPATTHAAATIGGEEGGRAPIVIDDIKPIQQADTTTLSADKIEPGRDIFADKKSVAPPARPDNAEDFDLKDKVVDAKVTTKAAEESSSQSEMVKDSEASTHVAESSSLPQSQASTEEVKKPAGPKVEVEAVADKVAQELYPDA